MRDAQLAKVNPEPTNAMNVARAAAATSCWMAAVDAGVEVTMPNGLPPGMLRHNLASWR